MFMNNVCLIAICVGILFVNQAHSEGDCRLIKPDGSKVTEREWTFEVSLPTKISDDSPATELLNYEAENIKDIETYRTDTISNLKYIEAKLIDEKGKKNFSINLTDNFKNYEENEIEEDLLITVNFNCKTDKRKLIIRQKIEDINNHDPQFFNDPYTYTLQMPLQKNFLIDSQQLIVARDIDITNKNITFNLLDSDEKTKGFSAIWVGQDKTDIKKFYGNLLTTDVIDLDEDVTFKIFATDKGTPPITVNTTVTIKVDNVNSSPKFSQHIYRADLKSISINMINKIPIKFDNPIKIVRGVERNLMISHSSNNKDYDKYFTHLISADYSEIGFELINPSKELLNEKFLILELTVQKVRSSATAILYIELPGMLVHADESSLNFEKVLYRVDRDDQYTGLLITEAVAKLQGGNDIIDYSLSSNTDTYLKDKISIDATAKVNLIKALDPGFYTFDIEAEAKKLKLSAKTEVLLIISSTEMEFEYALQMVKVEEESEHPKVLSLGNDSCSYTILSQTPSQDPKWFYITDNFLSSKKIDRESPLFSNMLSAQVRLVVEATCRKKSFVNQRRDKRDGEYDVIVGNIPFTRSQMQIVAMITDINDNPPIWDTKIPKVIGYPSKDVSKFVVPPSVYSLSATDADIGENAIITYSLKNSSSFYIHPKEGTLYVREGVPIETNLTAIASDGPHNTPLELSIQMLNDNNIVALYLTNAVIEDLDSILSELSTTMNNPSNCWLGSIGAAVISDNEAALNSRISSKDSNKTNTLLRILVYGIDLNSNSAVESSLLKSALENPETSSKWYISKISTLDEVLPPQSQGSGETNNSYKVATIILSLVIAVAVIGFVVFMVRYRRFTIFV